MNEGEGVHSRPWRAGCAIRGCYPGLGSNGRGQKRDLAAVLRIRNARRHRQLLGHYLRRGDSFPRRNQARRPHRIQRTISQAIPGHGSPERTGLVRLGNGQLPAGRTGGDALPPRPGNRRCHGSRRAQGGQPCGAGCTDRAHWHHCCPFSRRGTQNAAPFGNIAREEHPGPQSRNGFGARVRGVTNCRS